MNAFIWQVPEVGAEPDLTLVRWRVLETADGGRFLVGYCVERREGRVSTQVTDVDVSRMQCRTTSGRIYRLEGPPALDPDGDFIWRAVVRARKIESWKEVSAELCERGAGNSRQGAVDHT